MKISFPDISQTDILYAIECLEDCKKENAEAFGFMHPYFAPGGAYGGQWWQLDSSLALAGYKWIDRKFAETALLNFVASQKEDGRICLWGKDVLPETVAGGDKPGQRHDVSSLPKIFDVAYHILAGSSDISLKTSVYGMMKKYLQWWFAKRQDPETGLITAVFEETFIPYLGCAGEYAPVDTNTEIYVGLHYTACLAEQLGIQEDAKELNEKKKRLQNSINTYLWNEEKGAYFPYDVKESKTIDCLMASTFFPLRLGIAPKERQKKLIVLLQDHTHFNWDTIPLTSVSKVDKIFTVTEGDYQGNASWSGNVWSLLNEMVIRGLVDCGENELAAELALKTVQAFSQNCAEFINPFNGNGHGVQKYAWTASQYLEIIIEIIFGIHYEAETETVSVSPKLTKELKNRRLSLENIRLTETKTLQITIENGNVFYDVI